MILRSVLLPEFGFLLLLLGLLVGGLGRLVAFLHDPDGIVVAAIEEKAGLMDGQLRTLRGVYRRGRFNLFLGNSDKIRIRSGWTPSEK